MSDFTEQWKKGELPEGHYYVKDSENIIAEYLDGYFYNNGQPMTSFSGGVDSVLEKVPSYEEWVYLHKARNDAHEIVESLTQENQQLKELLKECKHIMSIEKDFASCHFEKDKLCKLLAKINQALGEECELVGIEKQVWESTLNRSMMLQAENDKLKTDCRTLAKKLLQVKPELREWLEINFKGYL